MTLLCEADNTSLCALRSQVVVFLPSFRFIVYTPDNPKSNKGLGLYSRAKTAHPLYSPESCCTSGFSFVSTKTHCDSLLGKNTSIVQHTIMSLCVLLGGEPRLCFLLSCHCIHSAVNNGFFIYVFQSVIVVCVSFDLKQHFARKRSPRPTTSISSTILYRQVKTTIMTQEEEKRFGTLPEELVVKVVELVDSTDILALRGVSKQMKRLTYDRFAVEFFADIRQDISSRALATLGDITSHEHIRKEINSISFGSSIESVAGTGQEAQEVWLKYLMTEVMQNLKDAGKSVFLGTHTNISESPDDDTADAIIRLAIDDTGLIVKGITLEDDLGDYLALLEIRPAANSSNSSRQAETSSSQAEVSSSTDPSVAATTEPAVEATQVTTTRAVWKTKLPLDRFPREVAYTDTTGTLLVKCSNCTVESFPPLPLGLCTCLLANLDELNFTGRFSDKSIRTLFGGLRCRA